jgi:hypothetical protein
VVLLNVDKLLSHRDYRSSRDLNGLATISATVSAAEAAELDSRISAGKACSPKPSSSVAVDTDSQGSLRRHPGFCHQMVTADSPYPHRVR